MLFEENTPASLLIGSNGPRKGLRVQAEVLRKEFIDDDLIGRGPTGILRYNDIKDFAAMSNNEPVRHRYKVIESESKGRVIVTVQFTHSLDKFSKPYAEFEGSDRDRTIANNRMDKYEFQGQWVDFDIIQQSAFVTGGPGEKTVLSVSEAQAKWSDKENKFTKKFKIHGDLFYKDDLSLLLSQRVSYNQGGLIFYQKDGVNPNHTAYFVPNLENFPGHASLSGDIAWGPGKDI